MKQWSGHVILSEETVGEPIEQAHREYGRDHVILSEAKDLKPCADLSSPPEILRFTQDDTVERICNRIEKGRNNVSWKQQH